MNKDLITSYVDGESTNNRLNNIQQARQYNQNIRNTGYTNIIAPTELSNMYNQAPRVDFSKRTFGETAKDAWHLYLNRMNESDIQASDDIITKSNMDLEDAEFLEDWTRAMDPNAIDHSAGILQFSQKYGMDPRSDEAAKEYESRLNRLVMDGVFTENRLPNVTELQEIQQNAIENREEAQKNRDIDVQDLKNSQDSWDISQYATKKANEAGYNWGNFLYKTASMFGSSHSSLDWQLLSTAAGAVAATVLSAFTGGSTAPAAAQAWTALGSATAAQAAGGIQARMEESHIEAGDRYASNVEKQMQDMGIDKKQVIDKARRQLSKNPEINAIGLSDDDVFKLVLNGSIDINDNAFEQARRVGYRGTRELYEKNMSLQAGDIVTDMLFYVPGFRNSRLFRIAANPMEAPIEAVRYASNNNAFKSFLSNRLKLNSNIARESLSETTNNLRTLTGKEIAKKLRKDDYYKIAGAQIANMLEEGSEEGAQYIWSHQAENGEFGQRRVSTNLWDAITNGNLVEDLADSWLVRNRSTLAMFTPFDPVYSSDDEFRENYLSGMLLSTLDPTALTFTTRDIINATTGYKKNKRFGEIFERALEEQDYVDRSVDLLQAVRQLDKSGRHYSQILDAAEEMMKSGKYDLGVISDNNQEVDENAIQEFMQEERDNFDHLMKSKKFFGSIAQGLGMTERDQDIYTAIANNIKLKADEQADRLKQSQNELFKAFQTETDDSFTKQLRQKFDDIITKTGRKDSYSETELNDLWEAYQSIAEINSRISSATKFSQRLGNQTEAMALLKEQGTTGIENAVTLKRLQDAADAHLSNLINQKVRRLNVFAQKLRSFGFLQSIEESLQQARETSSRLRKEEPDIDQVGIEEYTKWYNDVILEQENKIRALTTQKDEYVKEIDDVINSVADAQITDPNKISLTDRVISDTIESQKLDFDLNQFVEGDKETINLVKKYKNRVLRQAAERDAANNAAQGNTEETVQPQTLTDEELNQSINDFNDQIVNLLSEAAAVSPTLQRLLQRISRGINVITDPLGRARYLRNSLNKFNKQLENIPKDEMTTEDKETYSRLKNLVDQASKVLDTVDKRASDKAFNAQRRKFDIKANVQEWTGPDGKKFVFLTGETEHSVDEGVILHAIDVTDDSDIKEYKEQIKDAKKKLTAAQKRVQDEKLDKEERDIAKQQALHWSQQLKNLQQDLQNNLAKRRVEFKVSEQEEYLNQLTTTNNQKKTITFEKTLQSIKKNSDEILTDLAKKRDTQQVDDDYVNNDLSDEENGTKNSSPDWLEEQEQERIQKKEKFKVKAYAFTGTRSGVAYKNRLFDPFYEAEQWFGSVQVQLWEDVKDFDFANAESTKDSKIKWSRPKAYSTFNKLLKLCRDKNDQEIFDIFQKAKKGQINGITKQSYENMIGALPIQAVLFNNRLRTSNGVLMPTRLVTPDITSRNRQSVLSEYEAALRENMIMNLVRNNEEGVAPKINIAKGNVRIFYQSFLQNTRDVLNPENPVLLAEDGTVLSNSEVNEKYDSSIAAKGLADKVRQSVKADGTDEISKVLMDLGYDIKDLFDAKQPPQVTIGDQQYDAISYLLRGVGKLGDSVLKSDSFINQYLIPVLGKSSKRLANRENAVQRIVDAFMEVCPEVFLNYDEVGGVSLDTDAQVDAALSNGYRISINIKYNGNQLILKPTTRDVIVQLAEQIEGFIKSSSNRTQFMEELKDAGYEFDNSVAKILAEYFVNRKFNRLVNPSNIVNVLTSGKAVPTTNYLVETRKKVTQQGKISEVKALGIIFDESTGQFYYSRDKYKTHIEKLQQTQTDEETEQDDSGNQERAIEEGYQGALQRIKYGTKAEAGKRAISEMYDGITWEQVVQLYNENNKDKSPVSTKRWSIEVARWFIGYKRDQQLEELRKSQELEEPETVEDVSLSLFEGKDNEPVTIAYATANGTIMRYDTYDKKMVPMSRATGKAGSIYLVLPSFFNSNRNRIPVKLNPQKIDINVARVIAKLMHMMATGQIDGSQPITDRMIDGLRVHTGVPVEQFIRQLMYYGTEAIQRNPSNENLGRLVYIRNGSVFFGNTLDGKGTEVTEENIEEFAQWISQNKNYRVDKDMLESDATTVSGTYDIVDENGNIVLTQEDGDNYIANLISSGKIMTDMDPNEDSTIFGGNPQVYMDYVNHFEGITETEKTHKKKDSKSDTTSSDGSNSKKKVINTKKVVDKLTGGTSELTQQLGKVQYKLHEYLSSYHYDDSLVVEVNGRAIKVPLNNDGSLGDFRAISSAIVNAKNGLTLRVIMDGEEDTSPELQEILNYIPEFQTGQPQQPQQAPGAAPVSAGTVAQANLSFEDQLDEMDDLNQVQDFAKQWYDSHPEVKEQYPKRKDFVDYASKLWVGGSVEGDPAAILGGLDNTDKSKQNNGAPGSGLTPASEKVQPVQSSSALPPMNLGASPVVPATPASVQQPINARTQEQMASDPQVDTIARLVGSIGTENYNKMSPGQKVSAIQREYGVVFGIPNMLAHFSDKSKIGELIKKYDQSTGALHSAVSRFLKFFVRTEDYTEAIQRVKKILGEDFNFDVYTNLPLQFDKARNAMVYVYGVCTANGIRLFRDAAKNTIKRGAAYHEAFHRVSMLLMTPAERQNMYEALYKFKPELRNATERQKQEYLADMFADWVLKQVSNKNPIYKFINKIGEKIRNLITRLRKGVGGVEGRFKLHKLFMDMYQGKYAYLQASKENQEYFNLAFERDPLYSSFRFDGADMANSAQQFNDIYRNILAKIIEEADMLKKDGGRFKINFDALLEYYKKEQTVAKTMLDTAVKGGNIDEVMKANNYMQVINGIVDNWKHWKKYINRQARMKFSLEQINDPNNIDYSELIEQQLPEDVEDSNRLGIARTIMSDDSLIAQYCRNQFKSLDADVRLFLYTITESGDLTEDGLFKYANVYQLWHELCTTCSLAKNVDDMLNIINRTIKVNKDTVLGNTMQQFYDIMKDEGTSDYIKNKLFSNIIKYTNEFIIINYRKDDDGNFSVSVENSNMAKSQQTTKARWGGAIIDNIIYWRSQFYDEKTGKVSLVNLNKWAWTDEGVYCTINEKDSVQTVSNLTRALSNLFKEQLSEADVVKFISSRTKTTADIMKMAREYNSLVQSVIISKAANPNSVESGSVRKDISRIFNPAETAKPYNGNIILGLSEFIATDTVGKAKNDTVRIAKGAVAYIIGQYNHITRFFRRLVRDDEFMKMFKNNPYTKTYEDGRIKYQGSKWLNSISKKNYPVLYTLASTVYNSDYNSGNDFMSITPLEDMMDKFTNTIEGMHNIPELANKKTYYILSNVPMEPVPLYIAGTSGFAIQDKTINTFRGYILSEMMAIRDAMRQRKEFVDQLNKILGTHFTYKTLSRLSPEDQEKLFKNEKVGPLLGKLRIKYNCKETGGYTIKHDDGSKTYRSFGFTLEEGAAYKTRHFKGLVDEINITENTTDAQLYLILKSEQTTNFIQQMIEWNVRQVLEFMDKKGMIVGYNPEVSLPAQQITNRMLPEDNIVNNPDFKGIINTKKMSSQDWIRVISYFVVNNMCDIIEFEKIVSGDIAEYGSNMDSVNKRYSAQTSTTSIKTDKGVKNEFSSPELGEDELYNSSTYRTIELNTTFIDNLDKYRTEAKRFLGVDAFDPSSDELPLDYKKLLDKNGEISKEARKGELVKQYLDHYDNGRNYGKVKNMAELAKKIVKNADLRLRKYRRIDPTDAQTWIMPELNREFKMREGMWTSYDEACHNLLEHYDEVDVMKRVNQKAYEDLLIKLGIDETELLEKFNSYKESKLTEQEYSGYILSKVPGFIQGSLKYIHFGANTDQKQVIFIYDKTSLSPLYKIFCKGHIMQDVYEAMKENHVHMIKMNSCTKVGNLPSFELFDANGNVDRAALRASPKQEQLFEHIGRQLNTDPHESLTSTLLTQFMKVAMMNLDKNYSYRIGKNRTAVKGDKMLPLYQRVLDILTNRGFSKFCKEFGIDENTYEVNKEVFMSKLQEMAMQQDSSSELIDALNVDQGDYVIHPSAIPNINWIQSKLISAMDKIVIKTTIPGKPLFQVASLGFDNITNNRKYKAERDTTLRSYNEDGYMEVKLSISLFNDVLKQTGMLDKPFDQQKKFILENQEVLMALAYRVPTQGQNSTLPIKIVDLFEPQRGDIIMFPADITTLTGSDFDIDKMFLARYNIAIDENGKPYRIGYDINNLESNSNEELQNLLLDMYFSVLTSIRHRVDTVTPLDVTTKPLVDIKDKIQAAKNRAKDARAGRSGWWLNPLFQVEQRQKNASSSMGTGPMALNNVFRFFLQMSGLDMAKNKYFKQLGLSLKDGKNYRIFDRDGESILDSTSALINAFVDAVKDNYIGFLNVNTYTFDVLSMLISNGFGNSTYWFLGQQGICDIADAYIELKTGNIVADESLTKGNKFLNGVIDDYRARISDPGLLAESFEKAYPEEMTEDFMKENIKIKDTQEWYCQQLRYINAFVYMKQQGEAYRKSIVVAQIDTGKYGITANDVINFMQTHDQFLSEYNVSFDNPEVLFDKTFLGQKYEKGVSALFDMFGKVLLEFSPGYVNTINNVSRQLGIYGPYGKEQMKRLSQRIKTAIQANFFISIVRQMYPNSATPLHNLLAGPATVVDRYENAKERAAYTNEGRALFDVLKPALKGTGQPKFFNIDSSISDDATVKSNVTQAWKELYESSDPILSQYAKDLAIYMFFISGGADNNIGGMTRASIFELAPPTLIANLTVGNMTYNQYIQGQMDSLSKGNLVRQDFVETALALNAMFDDKFAVTLNKDYMVRPVGNNQDIISIGMGSQNLINYNTGTYIQFVKRRNQKGSYDLFRLGDVMFSEYTGKDGVKRIYMNPVYFKVNTIGYRNSRNPAYSVRADGYYYDGKINSYLWENKSNVSEISQLPPTKNQALQKIYDGMIPFGSSVDFAKIWDKIRERLPRYNGFGIPYAAFAAIDDADIVLFVNDDMNQSQLLINYAQFKQKQFRSVDPSVDKLGYNGKVFVIGSANKDTVDKLVEKMPKATFIVTDVANDGMRLLQHKVQRNEVTGKMYSTSEEDQNGTSESKSSATFTNERHPDNANTNIKQNLIDNGEKTIKECE